MRVLTHHLLSSFSKAIGHHRHFLPRTANAASTAGFPSRVPSVNFDTKVSLKCGTVEPHSPRHQNNPGTNQTDVTAPEIRCCTATIRCSSPHVDCCEFFMPLLKETLSTLLVQVGLADPPRLYFSTAYSSAAEPFAAPSSDSLLLLLWQSNRMKVKAAGMVKNEMLRFKIRSSTDPQCCIYIWRARLPPHLILRAYRFTSSGQKDAILYPRSSRSGS